MSLLVTLILLAVAYFLFESGLTIVALVVFLLALLHALQSPSSSRGAGGPIKGNIAGYAGQRPIIVTTTGGKIPETLKIVTKKPWPGTSLGEDFWVYLGGTLQWPFRILIRLLTGKSGKVHGDKPL